MDESISRDDEIVRSVLEGEVDRFEELIRAYKDRVFRLLLPRLPRDEVEIVAQDVFLSAFRSLESYVPRKPFERWISRIALRRCADYWRRRGRNRETPESQLSEAQRNWLERTAATDRGERAEEVEYAREILELVLDRLGADDRMLVDLVYLSGMSLKEAASLTGRSPAGTKVRAMRARRKMRAIIESLMEDEK